MSESQDSAVTISRRGQHWWILVGDEVDREAGAFDSPTAARRWLWCHSCMVHQSGSTPDRSVTYE